MKSILIGLVAWVGLMNNAGAQGHLVETQRNLAAVQGSLAETQRNLVAVQGSLAETPGNFAKTPGNLTKTQGSLVETPGNLAKTQGSLAETPGNFAKTPGNLTETPGNLTKTQENFARAQKNPAEALLHQMSQATEQLDYELSYMLVRKNSIEPLRYRHARVKGASFGQLMYLSGPSREAIRRGNEVSYFEPGIEPFTIITDRMVVPLPSIMHADINHLSTLYDFVPLGRAREAGLACDVVRVSPKDGERYSYVLWIDEKSKLLVRADLLDRDGEPIEQYRAVSLIVSPKISSVMAKLANIELPLVVHFPKKESAKINWSVTDLPKGFKPVFSHRHRLLITDRPVESLIFSDGLFTFSVYLAQADALSVRGQLVRKGRQTLHSHVKGNAEITVVGDIPPATAKKVAESVRFNPKTRSKNLDDKTS